jgi:hypothetical protein
MNAWVNQNVKLLQSQCTVNVEQMLFNALPQTLERDKRIKQALLHFVHQEVSQFTPSEFESFQSNFATEIIHSSIHIEHHKHCTTWMTAGTQGCIYQQKACVLLRSQHQPSISLICSNDEEFEDICRTTSIDMNKFVGTIDELTEKALVDDNWHLVWDELETVKKHVK